MERKEKEGADCSAPSGLLWVLADRGGKMPVSTSRLHARVSYSAENGLFCFRAYIARSTLSSNSVSVSSGL